MIENTLRSVQLEIGIIVSVNNETATCTVRTETSEVFHDNIPYFTIGLHQESGTGLTYYPQGGESVLICTSTDGKRFILGFIPTMDQEGSYDAGRPIANPGDWYLTGADGNFLILNRGGILRVGSSAICQSIYIPTKAIQHHLAENYIIETFAGNLEFLTKRKEDNGEGKQETQIQLTAREFSDDKEPTVDIKYGNGIKLTIKTSNNENIKIDLKKDGEITLTNQKSINIKSAQDMILKSDTNITNEANDINLKAKNKNYLEANLTEIKTNDLSINALTTSIKGKISLTEKAAFPVVILSPDLSAWFSYISAKNQTAPPSVCVNPLVLA